jgi:hypothetical protein
MEKPIDVMENLDSPELGLSELQKIMFKVWYELLFVESNLLLSIEEIKPKKGSNLHAKLELMHTHLGTAMDVIKSLDNI